MGIQLLDKSQAQNNIESILERFESQATRLIDFHVFSTYTLGRFGELFELEGTPRRVSNTRTNSTISEEELIGLHKGYIDNELPRVVLYELVALFESLLSDLGIVLLARNPSAIGNLQIKLEEIFLPTDKDEIIFNLTLRRLKRIMQGTIPQILEDFKKIKKYTAFSKRDVLRVSEIKATRNVLAHNGGIADEKYIEIAGNSKRANIGQRLQTDRPYVYGAGEFLLEFGKKLCSKLLKSL